MTHIDFCRSETSDLDLMPRGVSSLLFLEWGAIIWYHQTVMNLGEKRVGFEIKSVLCDHKRVSEAQLSARSLNTETESGQTLWGYSVNTSHPQLKVICSCMRIRLPHHQVILEKHGSFSRQRDFFNDTRLLERQHGIYWAPTKSCLCCHTGVNWLLAGSWHQQNSTVGLPLSGPVRGAEMV